MEKVISARLAPRVLVSAKTLSYAKTATDLEKLCRSVKNVAETDVLSGQPGRTRPTSFASVSIRIF
jgi:hypothetical protein